MKAASLTIAATAFLLAATAAAQPVRVVYVPEGIASQPDAAAWAKVPESVLTLSGQLVIAPVGGGSVAEMRVRAMHDGERIAIRLDWADSTVDREVGVDTFRDAVAVAFPLGEPDPLASTFMGDADHPVAIWQWTADFEANARGQGGFAERYPHTEGVWYFPQDAMVRRQVQAWRGTDPIIEYRAIGYGTLSRRTGGSVAAQSARGKDRWTVVLRRLLQTGDPEDPSFMPGEATQFLVAVWNGSGSEVDGRKSVTLTWIPFQLDATVVADAAR